MARQGSRVAGNGAFRWTSDTMCWAAANSVTTRTFYGIGFGNVRYVAVGAHGTMLTSTDGTTWTAIAPATAGDLRGVIYGSTAATSTTSAVATFVAVGIAGTLVTSPDGVAWTEQPPIATNDLAAVTYGTQFVTVGNGGGIFTSFDGLVWQPAGSGTTADLNGVTFTILAARSIGVGYEAVGNAGVNLTAF